MSAVHPLNGEEGKDAIVGEGKQDAPSQAKGGSQTNSKGNFYNQMTREWIFEKN